MTGNPSGSGDPYDLARFVVAQAASNSLEQAVCELRAGRKVSHWMWFVFPQVAGLGSSPMAQHFAISSLDEARAYLAHPLLGDRLLECTGLVAESTVASAVELLGTVDALKLRSSMTLYWRADPERALFARVLDRYYAGQPDPETDRRL